MKPKVKKQNKLLRFLLGDYVGITLAPFGIYVKEKYLNDEVLINHEKIHWAQQLEMLIVFFYLWYFIEWVIRLITPPAGAYMDISFEKEAYANEKDLKYLETRKHYGWIKWL